MKVSDLTYYVYNTQFGQITIAGNTQKITEVHLEAKKLSGTFKPTKITNDCSTQILQYFSGLRKNFNVPIKLNGTEFEKRVFLGLLNIKYGETVTPKQLAKQIGNPNAHRNITKAANSNKLAIIVPNHRLVPKSNFEKPGHLAKQRLALRRIEEKFSR